MTSVEVPHRKDGLRNYRLTELHPNAAAALENLYRQQWLCGVDLICECGRLFNTRSAVKCYQCRLKCSHLAINAYMIRIDGTCAPRAYCGWCGEQLADPKRGSWLYEYCFKDNRQDQPPQPCERCDDPSGTQLHHWGPRAIFKDYDAWPTGWLCVRCHDTWHKAMHIARGRSLPWDQRVKVGNGGHR